MVEHAVSWAEFAASDPALAQRVAARLDSHRHAVMATLRADGSPRLSGMEAPVRSGHLWLAMDPVSRKTSDLERDPRFSLHSSLDSEDLPNGDARVDGLASPADAHQRAEFIAGHRYDIEDPSLMVLFTALIQRVVLVRVADKHLLIESWTPAEGHRTQSRQ